MKELLRRIHNLRYVMGVLIVSFMISSHISGTADFQLLSETEEGVSYFKNPCRPDAFTLTFSFSEDVKDLGKRSLALVAFSREFQNYLSPDNDKRDVDLFYSEMKRIGNRQFQIDYVARRILPTGEYETVELPDQVELILLEKNVTIITDTQERACAIPEGFKKKFTLINKNPNQKCSE